MIGRIALLYFTLSLSLCLLYTSPSPAQKLSLPIGEWGHLSNHGLNCSRPFLKIETNRIVKRLRGGEGRCPIKSIKKDSKYLMIHVKCVYDKSIPIDYFVQSDDDDNSFFILIQGPRRILFNNSPHGLCKSVPGGGQ